MTVPAAVLAATRGKRALILGGQGAREEHRRALLAALCLASLDWAPGERGKAAPYTRAVPRILHRSYDLILLLASFAGHSSQGAVAAARETRTPLVYINGGYSVSRVAHEIGKQLAGGNRK